jgi:hypothetical protein
MQRQDYITKIGQLLSRLVHEVKVANAIGLFDINKVTEDFYVPILSVLFDCPDLKNQNRIKPNFPAIDLGCETRKISFQITSDPASAKITETLRLFEKHGLSEQFDTVYVFVLTEKQANYSSGKLQEQIDSIGVNFTIKDHIIDYKNLASMLSDLDTETLKLIYDRIDQEFSDYDRNLKFKKDFDRFLEFAQSKIEFEKNSKKYIPAVFIETSSSKELVRHFANPIFFHGKVADALSRIRLDRLDELFAMAGLASLRDQIQIPSATAMPETLGDLRQEQLAIRETLQSLIGVISPFSMDSGSVGKFVPPESDKVYRRIWSYPIESCAYGIQRQAQEATTAIELSQAKILLITGMAGQGKTNFVCDLTENMFRKFQVPAVFLPARELNNFSGQDRIFQFITNNRYAPQVADLHTLLELFNEIARESNKPFVIVIDGINEVGVATNFCAELAAFLAAVCQYDFVKVLLTCRSEFFEHRFSSILHEPFSTEIYRIDDLRSKMSDKNKEKLLSAYFQHFSIKLQLTPSAANFLKNDLLLLRIFCENHQGRESGVVNAIYKGELFETFLVQKAENFPERLRTLILPTLYKIAANMLANDAYASLPTSGFSGDENEIVEQFISEDIVLRREVTEASLTALGVQNISFTYDELRDFIVGHYLVTALAKDDIEGFKAILGRLTQLPIHEGAFRYTYLLARKEASGPVIGLCEAVPDFDSHFANNVDLIPPALQLPSDADRSRALLATGKSRGSIRKISFYLYSRRNLGEILNIGILIDHICTLDDKSCSEFLSIIISGEHSWGDGWTREITKIVSNFITAAKENFSDDRKIILPFMLQLSGFADYENREAIFNRFASLLRSGGEEWQFEKLIGAQSETIRRSVQEIIGGGMEA